MTEVVKKISDSERVHSLRVLEGRCREAETNLIGLKEAVKAATEAYRVAVQELRQGVMDDDLPLFNEGDDDAT